MLFLPGHAGSFAQVRSLASETARQMQRARKLAATQHSVTCATCSGAPRDGGQDAAPNIDSADGEGSCAAVSAEVVEDGDTGGFGDLAWYTADFGEELSAFDGQLLVRARPLDMLCSFHLLTHYLADPTPRRACHPSDDSKAGNLR